MMGAPIEVGIAQLALPGETESGDRCVIEFSGNRTMFGVIDGLGHGTQAARAAEAAVHVLKTFAHEPLSSLMWRCHEGLQGTRGAAITLMSVDSEEGLLEWVGVGNVLAILLHPGFAGTLRYKELFGRAGVVGVQLPSIAVSGARIAWGDMIVVATDGVRPNFVDGIERCDPPQQLADRLLAQYQTKQDDALVMAARIQGEMS